MPRRMAGWLAMKITKKDDSHETEPGGRNRPCGCGPLAASLLLVLPVLYVLSDGPAWWLWSRGYLPEELLLTLYAPLNWLADRSDAISLALDWYESLWIP